MSIKHRAISLALCSVVLAWSLTLLLSYIRTVHEVDAWQGARLSEFANVLAKLDRHALLSLSPQYIEGRIENPPSTRGQVFDDSDTVPRELFFRAIDTGGNVIAESHSLPNAVGAPACAPGDVGVSTFAVEGKKWQRAMATDGANLTVCVVASFNEQSDLSSTVATRIILPTMVALPGLVVLIWLSIGYSLRPLEALAAQLKSRNPSSLEPIAPMRMAKELLPLADAINFLLTRIAGTFERERNFTANAAHELRTPLAGVKVQAQVALGEQDATLRSLAISRIVEGVDRSAYLIEQLLLLARIDNQPRIVGNATDLRKLIPELISLRSNAHDTRIDSIVFQDDIAPSHPAIVMGDPSLLSILIANLIDNALKYGGSSVRVEVRLALESGRPTLVVRDDGPGVSDPDARHLTQRFFRVLGSEVAGTGLGLSIVARIVEHVNGQLVFGKGIAEKGLGATILFPHVARSPEE